MLFLFCNEIDGTNAISSNTLPVHRLPLFFYGDSRKYMLSCLRSNPQVFFTFEIKQIPDITPISALRLLESTRDK